MARSYSCLGGNSVQSEANQLLAGAADEDGQVT